MALNIARLPSGINTRGGGFIKVREVNEDGTSIAGAPVVDLGFLKDSAYNDKTESTPIKDERGLTITQDLGDREVMVTGTFLQSNKGILDIPEECPGKFYELYKLNSRPGSLTAQEIFFGVGTITPNIEFKTPGGEIPFEYKASALVAAKTIATSSVTSSGTAGFAAYATSSVTIPINKYRVVVETATPSGV